MMHLTEAFKKMDLLNEDTFEITNDGLEKLKEFENQEFDDDYVEVIDTEAETEDDISDSYIGQVILDCNVCHSKLYKNKEDVVVEEEDANIEEECPFCYSTEGFKVIGEVAPYGAEIEDSEEEKEEFDEDDEIKEDETNEEIDDVEAEETENELDESLEKEELEESIDDLKGYNIIKKGEFFKVTDDNDVELDIDFESEDDAREYINTISDDDLTESKSINENINNLSLDTEDTHMEMTSDESGKVTITTEPIIDEVAENEQVIAPVSDETEADILDNGEEEITDETSEEEIVDMDMEEFDEESFDELGEAYFKEAYDNVEEFKTTDVSETEDGMLVEGMLKFNSGNCKKTSFLFESNTVDKSNKVRLIGENKELKSGKESFIVEGLIQDKKLISESLEYKYAELNGKVSRG